MRTQYLIEIALIESDDNGAKPVETVTLAEIACSTPSKREAAEDLFALMQRICQAIAAHDKVAC